MSDRREGQNDHSPLTLPSFPLVSRSSFSWLVMVILSPTLLSSLPPLLHVVGRPLYARPSLLHPVGAERVNVVSERSPRWRKNDDTGEDEERERRRSERQGNRGAALTRSSSPSTTSRRYAFPTVVMMIGVKRRVTTSRRAKGPDNLPKDQFSIN